jgi:hypothetical protein
VVGSKWVHSARRELNGLLYLPRVIMMMADGEFGRMKIGRGNRSTRRKPTPAPLYPPQIPLDQTRARNRAAAVGSQRVTAWAMARPWNVMTTQFTIFCCRTQFAWIPTTILECFFLLFTIFVLICPWTYTRLLMLINFPQWAEIWFNLIYSGL